jgi:hypothetical protein
MLNDSSGLTLLVSLIGSSFLGEVGGRTAEFRVASSVSLFRASKSRLPRGVNIARQRDAPAKWSQPFEALGLAAVRDVGRSVTPDPISYPPVAFSLRQAPLELPVGGSEKSLGKLVAGPDIKKKLRLTEVKGTVTFGTKRRGLRMIVKHLTAQQRLGFGDKKKKEAKAGFYWQAEVDDAWIGPFETLEDASTDGKQCCFGVV